MPTADQRMHTQLDVTKSYQHVLADLIDQHLSKITEQVVVVQNLYSYFLQHSFVYDNSSTRYYC